MGRYYSGDIEGKFWFALQSSDAADRFGVVGTQPNVLNYYFDESDLEAVEEEIANIENIAVTPEELEIRLQILKGQYKDSAMQSELDKPEVIRDIESRLITEKTIAKLAEYASK